MTEKATTEILFVYSKIQLTYAIVNNTCEDEVLCTSGYDF